MHLYWFGLFLRTSFNGFRLQNISFMGNLKYSKDRFENMEINIILKWLTSNFFWLIISGFCQITSSGYLSIGNMNEYRKSMNILCLFFSFSIFLRFEMNYDETK